MSSKFQSSFVSVDAAKSLKEVGFSEPCLFSYSEGIGITAMVSSNCQGNTEFSIDDFLIDGASKDSPFIGIPTYTQVFGWYLEKGYYTRIENLGDSYKATLYYTGYEIETKNDLRSYEEALDYLVWELISTSRSDKGTQNSYIVSKKAPRPNMPIGDSIRLYDSLLESYRAALEKYKDDPETLKSIKRSINILESEREKELKKSENGEI